MPTARSESHVLRGDELQQHRLAFLGRRDAVDQRMHHLLRLGDALAVAAQRLGEVGVIAGDVGGAILLARHRHRLVFHRHREVVEQDRHDRDLAAHAGLEVHAGHADGRIAPHVDAQLVGMRELGAHRQPQAVAQLRRLAPADVAERRRRTSRTGHLVARAAGIVRDDVLATSAICIRS